MASNNGTQSRATADRSLDVAYPLTYYPDMTDSEARARFRCAGGAAGSRYPSESRSGAAASFSRAPATQTRGLRFRNSSSIRLVSRLILNATVTSMVSPGVMEVSGIPAGRYDVSLMGQERKVTD